MSDRCISLTQKNKRCSLRCQEGHIYCSTHIQMCRSLAEEYQDICKPYWYSRCATSQPKKMNRRIKKGLEKCHRLRCKFAQECCGRKGNPEHIGALVKIQERLEVCEKLIF